MTKAKTKHSRGHDEANKWQNKNDEPTRTRRDKDDLDTRAGANSWEQSGADDETQVIHTSRRRKAGSEFKMTQKTQDMFCFAHWKVSGGWWSQAPWNIDTFSQLCRHMIRHFIRNHLLYGAITRSIKCTTIESPPEIEPQWCTLLEIEVHTGRMSSYTTINHARKPTLPGFWRTHTSKPRLRP